jgi:hypothetical protein
VPENPGFYSLCHKRGKKHLNEETNGKDKRVTKENKLARKKKKTK